MTTTIVQETGRAAGGAEEIRYYENAIPDFVAEAMDACYGALYSSVAYLRLAGKLSASTCTYVASSGGAIRSVFLFERAGATVLVLNGAIKTEADEVRRFADHVFASMPGVDRIRFPGVHLERLRLPYPCQRVFAGEDIVVNFAGTAEEYAHRLGKSTRKILKRHAAELDASHPGACYRLIEGRAAEAQLVDRIAAWNRRHMAEKHRVCAYRDEDVRHVAALLARGGMVGAVLTEDRIRAGTVCCQVGCSLYLLMTGYDGAYAEFSLGMLCNYWTAMAGLRMQCKEINLMGGRLPYKTSLLGQPRRYDSLLIYRDRRALARNAGEAVATALRGCASEAKRAILDCERKPGRVARWLTRALDAWRAARRLARGIGRRGA